MPEAEETITIRLSGRWEGWTAEMDADPDWGTTWGMQSGTYFGVTGSILRNCRSWTFRDKTGAIAPLTEEGIKTVSRRAILALAEKYSEEYQALPKN